MPSRVLATDYVALPVSILPVVPRSWVDVHHDSTFTHEDHLPVAILCKGWFPIRTHQRKLAWDEKDLIDPIRCAQFRQAFATLPKPCWTVGVDMHADLYEKQLLHIGAKFFAKPPGKRRLIELQVDALEAVRFKRQVFDLGRRLNKIQDPLFRAELNLIEKEVHQLVRRDIQQHYDTLVQQLQQSGDISDHRMVYRLLTRLGRKKGQGPKGPKPLPMLRSPDGTKACTYEDQQ